MYKEINTFAIRSFRETADKDYVHARMAYQADLIPQFFWSSIHALEKYSKCMLLLGRIKNTKPSHNASKLIDKFCNQFDIKFSKNTIGFVKKLEMNGASNRYYETSWSINEPLLVDLDQAVWELRKMCVPGLYDYSNLDSIKFKVGVKVKVEDELQHIKKTKVEGGWLENVLDNNEHPARKYLVYSNYFFSNSKRKSIMVKSMSSFGNSPLLLNPEIIDELNKLVYLPKSIQVAYKSINNSKR